MMIIEKSASPRLSLIQLVAAEIVRVRMRMKLFGDILSCSTSFLEFFDWKLLRFFVFTSTKRKNIENRILINYRWQHEEI